MNDTPMPPDEHVLDRAIGEIRQLHVPVSPGAQSLLVRTRTELVSKSPHGPKRRIPRRAIPIMAASMAAISFFVGWLLWNSSSPIALAQVIEAATKHRIVRYDLRSYVRGNDVAQTMCVCYVDLKLPRSRSERREVGMVFVQDNRKDRMLVLQNRGRGFALLMRIPDIKVITHVKTDKTFLEILRSLRENKATTFNSELFDGRHANKYSLTIDETKSVLWVDAKTNLPIRIEFEFLNPPRGAVEDKWVYTGFEWDVDIENLDDFFSLEPPAGYIVERD